MTIRYKITKMKHEVDIPFKKEYYIDSLSILHSKGIKTQHIIHLVQRGGRMMLILSTLKK